MRKVAISWLAGALLAVFAMPGIAQAGPRVIASDPAQGDEEHKAPAEVSITFDLVLDPEASELMVVDECGGRVDGDDLRIEANKMTISIAETPSGYYDMVYNAVAPAGVTGSTKGRITFLVHAGRSCGPKTASHGGHGGQEEPGSGGGQHSGHDGTGDEDGGSSAHSGGDHSAQTSSTSHTAHSTTGSMSSMNHSSNSGMGAEKGKGAGHGKHTLARGDDGDTTPIAAPNILGLNQTDISGGALLTALLLCMTLGIGGGYLVRKRGLL